MNSKLEVPEDFPTLQQFQVAIGIIQQKAIQDKLRSGEDHFYDLPLMFRLDNEWAPVNWDHLSEYTDRHYAFRSLRLRNSAKQSVRKIIFVLYSEGELNNGDLARAAGISTRTLEKHKKLLIDERLAFEVKRDGQKFYALDEGRAIFFLYRLLKLDEWTRYLKDRPVLWPRVISEVTSMDGYLLLTRKQCEECGLGSIMTDERRLEATMNLPGGSLKVNNAVNDSDTFWISWLDLLSSLQQLKFNELCEKIFIRIKEGSVCPNCSKPKDDLFLLSHVSTNELNDFVCGKCGHVWQRREEAPKGDKDRDFESKYPMSSFKARRRPPKDYSSYNKLGVKNPLKRSYLRNTNKPIAEGSTSEAS